MCVFRNPLSACLQIAVKYISDEIKNISPKCIFCILHLLNCVSSSEKWMILFFLSFVFFFLSRKKIISVTLLHYQSIIHIWRRKRAMPDIYTRFIKGCFFVVFWLVICFMRCSKDLNVRNYVLMWRSKTHQSIAPCFTALFCHTV